MIQLEEEREMRYLRMRKFCELSDSLRKCDIRVMTISERKA